MVNRNISENPHILRICGAIDYFVIPKYQVHHLHICLLFNMNLHFLLKFMSVYDHQRHMLFIITRIDIYLNFINIRCIDMHII